MNNDLLKKMDRRYYLKKTARRTRNHVIWSQYRKERNSVSNAVKRAKREYFVNNLERTKRDLRKTWKIINELNSCQKKSTDIVEIKLEGSSITSPADLAEVLNYRTLRPQARNWSVIYHLPI